jgi:hypothetical protein
MSIQNLPQQEELFKPDGSSYVPHCAHFDGKTYSSEFDHERLGKQMQEVYLLMKDGGWRTLAEIEKATGYSVASISARLRDLRKKKFGSHTVERQARGDRSSGLFEYRLKEGTR